LLKNYLDGAEFSSSELCDAIIKQNTVGSVVKTQGAGDELDPIAIMSVVNVSSRKDMSCIKEIAAHLKNKCPKDLKDQLSAVLVEQGVGLIINERVMNIPQETAPPLVEGLFNEIGWATEDEPTEELREYFKFKKYILLTRVVLDDDNQEANKKRKRDDDEPTLVYLRPEDQIFHKMCKWSFHWKVRGDGESDELHVNQERVLFKMHVHHPLSMFTDVCVAVKNGIDDLTPMRLCMLVDAKDIPQARSQIKSLFEPGNFIIKV